MKFNQKNKDKQLIHGNHFKSKLSLKRMLLNSHPIQCREGEKDMLKLTKKILRNYFGDKYLLYTSI